MPGRLRVSEWIALAYFLYLIALAAVARVSLARRQRVLATAPVTALPGYGLLPWLPTRPPRAVELPETAARSAIRALNVKILDRASVQLNTFPSGHTAASIAIALAVGSHLPLAGAVLGIVAVSIAAASVIGRYHYAADAIVGAGLAIAAFAASRLIG